MLLLFTSHEALNEMGQTANDISTGSSYPISPGGIQFMGSPVECVHILGKLAV